MTRKPSKKNGNTLASLTGRNIDGVDYERTPEVERQIISSLALSDQEVIVRATIKDKDANGYLQEEALVYLIQKSFKERALVLYDALTEILVERCQDQVSYRHRALVSELKADAYAGVFLTLFEKICALDGTGDFLQVRFWKVFDRIAIDVFRKYYRQQTKDRKNLQPSSFLNSESHEDEWEIIVPKANLNIPDNARQSSVEMKSWIKEAIHVLEEPKRTVFVLYYEEDWPIDSKNPDDWTLMKRYNVSARTINNWLREAKNDLKKWLGDHHE